ncbi:MAG: hypothetical protein ACK8QZ_07770 [Anaerolineales bacterium]
MKATLLAPHNHYMGNILWREAELAGNESLLKHSLTKIGELGYWVSCFPERDGVAFKDEHGGRSPQQMLFDFQSSFPWLTISLGTQSSSNLELAALESEAENTRTLACKVIVPVLKLHFESSFDLGPFRLVCARELDPEPYERLGDWEGSYLEFDIVLPYPELLRLNRHVKDNDVVILQCLAMAEHAMDLIRFRFSSFERLEFTPDPAGQLENGFYAVEIIPLGRTHLKPVNLNGISRPMSASNNWLGPEIDDHQWEAREYLEEILRGRSDELALAVKGALRFIRQAFYSLGDESKFLTLVFALDGLAHPKKNWVWMTHHAFIAALTSRGDIDIFKADLERYEELYTQVRNVLVHNGQDFYQLPYEPARCCEDMFGYLKNLVILVGDFGITTVADLRAQAVSWLNTPAFSSHLAAEVVRVNARDGKIRTLQSW